MDTSPERIRLACEILGLKREDFEGVSDDDVDLLMDMETGWVGPAARKAYLERRVQAASAAIAQGPGAVARYLLGDDPES